MSRRRLDAATSSSVTVVIPTYREAANLPHVLDRLADVRAAEGLALDVLVVDDDSRDGTVEILAARPEPWIRLIVRTRDRGLSAAVLDGLQQARGDVLVCMDADLSHPASAIPRMLDKLADGADFVLGSRYVDGGSTADDWGFLRWLNSRVATLLARPLTTVKDPMSGFFALRRTTFEGGRGYAPVGYKIGLELMVKCACERVVEVPIHFDDRRFGESKLTLRQQLLFLQHLRRLYIFKFGVWTQLTQFLIVGALGTAVNLGILTALLRVGLPTQGAVAAAILGAMVFNFVLNRRFSFAGARSAAWPRQLARFVGASSLGAIVNYLGTMITLARFTPGHPQLAALVGIALGTGFNFIASRYLVFREGHVRLTPR
ncbi:MAG: glycosyltransferase family 2 protein [Acidobacteria bacterium]|nr:glycosyltransferase family 2 protein [Acidobacteriota bacterium]